MNIAASEQRDWLLIQESFYSFSSAGQEDRVFSQNSFSFVCEKRRNSSSFYVKQLRMMLRGFEKLLNIPSRTGLNIGKSIWRISYKLFQTRKKAFGNFLKFR